MGIEFRILGPLEVRVDSTAVAVGGPRQRALLAMLLLSANQVVSRDRLIDELLDGAAPDKADHMLRVQVSRLRAALSLTAAQTDRLTARPPGYVLRVEPGELDLQVFEDLLAEGHEAIENQNFESAATTLRAAESLWRGRPLADLEFERFARIDIERLEELRLVGLEERTDAELALGRHAMLVPELEARVAEHPLRERSRAQLMLALYRCGRQADALEAYREVRARLSGELALEPGPALRRLEQAILRQEADLDLPERGVGAVATAVAPPTPPPPDDRSPTPEDAPHRPARKRRRILGVGVVLGAAAVAVASVLLTSASPHPLTAPADSVAVLGTEAQTVGAIVPAGGPPGGIAAGVGAVWETDTANDLLLEINPRTRAVERIPVGNRPTGVAVGQGEVWVANELDGTVFEINPRSLSRVASFSVGRGAGAVAFGDGSLWVANVVDDTVARIQPKTAEVTVIPLAGEPSGLAVGPQGVWVASRSTGQLLLIDPSTDRVTQAVEIGNSPGGVVVGAASVWVANTSERTVSRFDPGSGNVTKINVGPGPLGITYGDGAAWVADSLAGQVARISPASNAVRMIDVGGAPSALAVSNHQVWATILAGHGAHTGGLLRVGDATFESVGKSLDPAEFAGFSQWQMLSLTNDGLVAYRRVGGLAGSTLVPDLATALPSPSDGGRTYTFQLRSGIRYSNGTLVRPEDIRHEFQRIYRLNDGYAEGFYTSIVGARACMRQPTHCTFQGGIATDNRTNTITFHLTAPDPDFLYKLTFPWADAIPATTSFHDLGRSMPPATGPYMTQSISPSRRPGPPGHGSVTFHTWTLVRNPRFREWNPAAQPQGYPDSIQLTDDASSQAEASAVAQNRLDVLVSVPPNRLHEFAVHYTQRFHSEPIGATFALVMNTRQAPFDRLGVRQALNYAIDRGRLVDFAGGPLAARPTCQVLPPTISGYTPYCPYTRDPSPGGAWRAPDFRKAYRLVSASGTRGMKITVLVPPPSANDPTTKIGPYVGSVLDRLGYRASLRVTSQAYPLLANSRSRAQIGWFNWLQDYPAPSDFITVLLSCRAFQIATPNNINAAEFCDPRVDAEARRASSLQLETPGAASAAWSAADRQITREAPWLPLYNLRLNIATSSRVGNYQYHPFWEVLLDQLWVR
jgi:ABC-type transport system substrate-binding protein/DNA-binding SARP family transcriptional activator/streptogramin lyase